MPKISRNLVGLVSLALVVTVLLQFVYTSLLAGVGILEGWPLRSKIWTIEILIFTGIAVASLLATVRSSDQQLGWAFLSVASIMNMVQSGIGLSMFVPASEAGPDFAPLMVTVLSGSFLFYYLAKVLLGSAAVVFGLPLVQCASTAAKIIGMLSILTGIAAMGLNIASMYLGLKSVPYAGAVAVTSTFFLGLAVWLSTPSQD